MTYEFNARAAAHEHDKLITRLSERMESAEDRLHSLWCENGTLKERIDALDDRITGMHQDYRNRIDDAHAEVSRLTAMSDRHSERIEAPDDRIDQIEQKLDFIGQSLNNAYNATFYPDGKTQSVAGIDLNRTPRRVGR